MSVGTPARHLGRSSMAHIVAGGIAAAATVMIISWTGPSTNAVSPAAEGNQAGPMLASQGHGATGDRPITKVRPVSCEPLPDIPGKSITTAVVEFPPGAYSPRHRHPGSVTAFVLSGTVRSQLLGGPAQVFAAGRTWFEPPGAIHLFAENASLSEPASLLATFVTDADCGPLTIPEWTHSRTFRNGAGNPDP